MEEWSFDVRFWSIQTYEGKRKTTYTVVWHVAGEQFRETFTAWAAADGFRSDLRSAHNKGRPFHRVLGLANHMIPKSDGMRWYELACAFAKLMWKESSGGHRRNIAEALTDITEALIVDGAKVPDPAKLRPALRSWSVGSRRPPAPGRCDTAAA